MQASSPPPLLDQSPSELPWSALARYRVVIAPVGGTRRSYRRRHLIWLRAWKRLLASDRLSRVASLMAPLWRVAPPHVAAEARALLTFTRHGPAADAVMERVLSLRSPAQPAEHSSSVVMVTPSLAAGGAERQMLLSARGLTERGWNVEILAKHLSDPAGHDRLLGEAGDVKVSLIPPPQHLAGLGSRLLELPPPLRETVVRLAGHFLQHRPAVVHAWMDEMSAAAGLAAVLAGVPRIILAGRNLAPHRFGLPQLPALRAALHSLARCPGVSLINNSAAGALDYTDWLDLPGNSIRVIRNGFQPLSSLAGIDWRSRLGIGRDVPVVGGLLRLAEEKRPLLWVETAAELARRFPHLHFVIFGDGRLRPQVEAAVARLGLSGRLHLPGVVTERAEALEMLDVFLLTSRYEGTPNVALECQWLGIPLVATEAGGLAETLEEPRLEPTGAAPQDLARAVEMRLGEPRHPRRQWVETRFGLDRMIADTLHLYSQPETQ